MQRQESMKVIDPRIEAARRGGLLVSGFKAWLAPVRNAELSLRERLEKSRTRAVWDEPRSPGARVAVTVTEHASAKLALQGLADDLEGNQLATLPAGPAEIGSVSFVHPQGAPPAVFFVRANLTIWVSSFGSKPVDVVAVARDVDADLLLRPATARPGVLQVTVSDNVFRVATPFGGEDLYLKAFAPGAELEKRDGDIVVRGDGHEVEVFTLEPGRETLSAVVRLRG